MKTITEAIEEFTSTLSVAKSSNTVDTYQVALRQFAQMFPETFTVDQLEVDHVSQFGQAIKQHAPATIQNYLTALSRFYKFIALKRWCTMDASDHADLSETIRLMRTHLDHIPHPVDDATITALLDEIKRTLQPASRHSDADSNLHALRIQRDTAIVLTLQVSGMRIGELVRLRREDMNWSNHSARVTGKGEKERTVYFSDTAWDAIEKYLTLRHDGAVGRALGSLPLFCRHDRRAGKVPRPLTTKSIERNFAEWCERCKLPVRVTPHTLRHSFATKVLSATGDLALVQDALGHQSPVTTRAYAKVSTKRIQDAVNAVF
jgi:site-specific recombinase XerD